MKNSYDVPTEVGLRWTLNEAGKIESEKIIVTNDSLRRSLFWLPLEDRVLDFPEAEESK